MYFRKVDIIGIAGMKPERGAESQCEHQTCHPGQDLKQFIHVIAGNLITISFINFFGMRIFGSDA